MKLNDWINEYKTKDGLSFNIPEYKISRILKIESDLDFLRYCSHAHALYWVENKFLLKRDNITGVTPEGGHGYVMCTVNTKHGDYYVSEECEAGMLLDWAKTKFNHAN